MLKFKVPEAVVEGSSNVWKKVTAPFIQVFGVFLFSFGGGLVIYATTWSVPFVVHVLGIMTGIALLSGGQLIAPSSRHT
jgi:nucleoside recognition membrane protein YjiH